MENILEIGKTAIGSQKPEAEKGREQQTELTVAAEGIVETAAGSNANIGEDSTSGSDLCVPSSSLGCLLR